MSEDFVQYLWRLQQFERKDLCTTEGQAIRVLHPGFFNASDGGPDFFQARIKIGAITWGGHVEVHTRSSDWRRHGHSADPAYDNVILHVVWVDDEPLLDAHGQAVPTLELHKRCDAALEQRYQALMSSTHPVLCKPYAARIPSLVALNMYDAALGARMEQKLHDIERIFESTGGDWAQSAQVWLFRHYGFRVNAEPMQRLGEVIPWKVIAWHQDQPLQLEALLFGMAGLLVSGSGDSYSEALYKEFSFLAEKYDLKDKMLNPAQWRMLRMRPANFPPVRLAQLAAFLRAHPQLDLLLEAFPKVKALDQALGSKVSTYWQSHYHFGKRAEKPPGGMGGSSRKIILTNVMVPLYFAFGRMRGEEAFLDQAMDFLRQLPAEKNRITAEWELMGFTNQHAYDSQALIGLYRHYCELRRCLECKIGIQLLKNQPEN